MHEHQCLILCRSLEYAASLARLCESQGYRVSICEDPGQAQADISRLRPDVVFLFTHGGVAEPLRVMKDLNPGDGFIVMMADTDIPALAQGAMQSGAAYYLCKPFDMDYIRQIITDRPGAPTATDKPAPDAMVPAVPDQFGYLRGSDSSMRDLYRIVHKVALTEASLLIAGESGTGKELVARTVHELSGRAASPFIAFNCAAVTDTLIESELFGHERGSFSGAHKLHRGFFEHAQGGTLLLDEITEMNQDLQAKLLRVLETRKLRRVGAEKDIELDVRIISTTNRIPEQAVQDGVLREDLYFRLAQIPVMLPPLRARGDDIGGLAQHFLNQLNAAHDTDTAFSATTLDALSQYHWPGNVRQLRNAVERAYVMSRQTIEVDDFPDLKATPSVDYWDKESLKIPLNSSLAEAERLLIETMLKNNDNNKKKTADDLGISLKTLYNRLHQYRDRNELRIVS